ncbi:HepT-like ribonuclease domain-containing protein [Fibrella arboris]|uniref:HepT-like ribonuclease domain-containing protein n=1 Tax=Fibrella arboris TaxID=3242486 RepID=UPI00352124A9
MPIPDKARLLHILEAIDYIDQFLVDKTKQDLYDNALLRFAIERQLEIIGEATNHLSALLKEQYPSIDWRKVAAFRNFIVHEYFGVDLDLVWSITQSNIPPLKLTVERMLSSMS